MTTIAGAGQQNFAPSVLFVCLGNICRSPTGEAVFRQFAALQGSLQLHVDSAGTSAHHRGEPADERMARAASNRGVKLTSISRQVVAEDFARFDVIVAMDRQNLRDLRALEPPKSRAELRLMSDFLDPAEPIDIPDPYYGGSRGFEDVLDLMETGCPNLYAHIIERAAAGVSRT